MQHYTFTKETDIGTVLAIFPFFEEEEPIRAGWELIGGPFASRAEAKKSLPLPTNAVCMEAWGAGAVPRINEVYPIVNPAGNFLRVRLDLAPDKYFKTYFRVLALASDQFMLPGNGDSWARGFYDVWGVIEPAPTAAASVLGGAKSEKKARAARENGKLGGRPRKQKDA
jgi:hypothetical protein